MKVKLTGVIAELTGSRELEVNPSKNVADVKQQLLLKVPDLNRFMMKVSVNSVLAGDKEKLHEDDDVLVFGAYAGG